MKTYLSPDLRVTDTLLQDFCKVVGFENPATIFPHQLTFLRHIDDPVGSPAVCTDRDAPMVKLGSECLRIAGEEDSPDHDSHDHDSHDHDSHDHGSGDESSASAAQMMAAIMVTGAAAALI